VPGRAVNDGRFSDKDLCVFAPGFSEEHAARDARMKIPAIWMGNVAVAIISTTLCYFQGMVFNQVFELTPLPEGQSLKLQTQSSDFIVWKYRFSHICI